MIAALFRKDIKLFFRNQFFAVITALALVAYIGIYLALPDSVDDSVGLGIYFEDPAATTLDEVYAGLFDYQLLESEAALTAALEDGEYLAGLALTTAEAAAIARGEPVAVDAYFAPGIPAELRAALGDVLAVIVNIGTPGFRQGLSQIGDEVEVLGPDLLQPLPIRDRLIPMLLMFILAIETMGVATLIMLEVEKGTARAVLTTPLRLSQFFTAKTLVGVALAFSQMLIIVVITGKITTSPLLLLVTLLLGSIMITGVSFVIAAISRDNMSVMAWSILFIVLFAIPAIGIVLPGLSTGWAELIPSFFLVDSLHQTLNFGASWAEVMNNLLILLFVGAGTLTLGSLVLRRRLQ